MRTFIKSIVLATIFFLLSCTSTERLAGHVYYRINMNPTTLDPAFVVDVTGGTIAAKLFNGLLKLSEDLNIVPDIAKDWSVSKDGRRYTFHLRDDVRFSNGREVCAADFKFSFERVMNPKTKSPNTWVFERIKGAKAFAKGQSGEIEGIRAINARTLEITLEEPFSPFLNLLTTTSAYVVPHEDAVRLGLDFSAHPVGTGPFVLAEWLPNRHLRLDPNASYFDSKPKGGGIVYRIIPEDLTAVAEFETGNLDILGVPASEYSRYSKSKKYKELMESLKGVNTYYLGLNCQNPPFDDPELRRAVAYAIDRRKMLSTIYEGRGRIATGPVPDILRSWPSPDEYEYNPQKAREIVGRLKPKPVLFFVTADQEVVDIAETIQSFLKTAGFEVSIRQLEWSAYKQAVNKGEANIFWLSWWADYPDPENFLFPLFHSSNHGAQGNRTRYVNHEVDRLIEAGQRAIDASSRAKLYRMAEAIIRNDSPWVFFWHKTDYALRQPWIEGFKIHPVYSIDKGVDVRINHAMQISLERSFIH